MDTWAVSTFGLSWIALLWTLMCTCLSDSLLLHLLGGYLGIELLGPMGILFNFWETTELFSKQWLYYFTFSPAIPEGSSFSVFPPHLLFSFLVCVLVCLFVDSKHSGNVKRCLTVLLICTSLMSHESSIFSCACWPCVSLLWRDVDSSPLFLFELSGSLFCCWAGLFRIF